MTRRKKPGYDDTPPPPAGTVVPSAYGYIHFKAWLYLTLGPSAYRKRDALGMPHPLWDADEMEAVRQGCEQVLEFRGLTEDRPFEELGIHGFYCLLALFHFRRYRQSMWYLPDGYILDTMEMYHAVTGQELTLFNRVEPP